MRLFRPLFFHQMDCFDDKEKICVRVMKGNGLGSNAISTLGSCKGTKALFEVLLRSISPEIPCSELEDILSIVRLCQDEMRDISDIANKIAQKVESELSKNKK